MRHRKSTSHSHFSVLSLRSRPYQSPPSKTDCEVAPDEVQARVLREVVPAERTLTKGRDGTSSCLSNALDLEHSDQKNATNVGLSRQSPQSPSRIRRGETSVGGPRADPQTRVRQEALPQSYNAGERSWDEHEFRLVTFGACVCVCVLLLSSFS